MVVGLLCGVKNLVVLLSGRIFGLLSKPCGK